MTLRLAVVLVCLTCLGAGCAAPEVRATLELPPATIGALIVVKGQARVTVHNHGPGGVSVTFRPAGVPEPETTSLERDATTERTVYAPGRVTVETAAGQSSHVTLTSRGSSSVAIDRAAPRQ